MNASHHSRLHTSRNISHEYSRRRATHNLAQSPVQTYISEGLKQYQTTIEAVRLHKSQANLNACILTSTEPAGPIRRSRSDTELDTLSSLSDSLLFQLEVERRARDQLKREKDELFRTTISLSSEVERARNACEDLRFKLELAKNRNPPTDLNVTRHFLSQSSSIEWSKLLPLDEDLPTLSVFDKIEWWAHHDAIQSKRDSGFGTCGHSEVTIRNFHSKQGSNMSEERKSPALSAVPAAKDSKVVELSSSQNEEAASNPAAEGGDGPRICRTPSPSRRARRPPVPTAPRKKNPTRKYADLEREASRHGRPELSVRLFSEEGEEGSVASVERDDEVEGGGGEGSVGELTFMFALPRALEFLQECNKVVTNLNRDAAQILAEIKKRRKEDGKDAGDEDKEKD